MDVRRTPGRQRMDGGQKIYQESVMKRMSGGHQDKKRKNISRTSGRERKDIREH